MYLLYQHNKVTKKVIVVTEENIIMEEHMIVIRDTKTFSFSFSFPKGGDDKLFHEVEFLIKSNETSARNKIRHEIEQLLLKYKIGNNIHEYGKQQNEQFT